MYLYYLGDYSQWPVWPRVLLERVARNPRVGSSLLERLRPGPPGRPGAPGQPAPTLVRQLLWTQHCVGAEGSSGDGLFRRVEAGDCPQKTALGSKRRVLDDHSHPNPGKSKKSVKHYFVII